VTDYALSQHAAPEVEKSRLRLLEESHDPLTIAQLDAIAVGEGWRCLDVGAGGGSVARILADRVGSSGSVVAVDLDTTLLEEAADERIEVRRHDLLADPLPSAAFDLVHARNLLMHLPSRLDALNRLIAALRPGGWILVSDPDFTTVALAPSSRVWERVWSAFLDATVAAGWDPRYGRRLADDLAAAAGIVEVHAQFIGRSGPGGSLSLLSMTIDRLRERMIALGAANDEIDEALRLLADPARTLRSPTICVARGRRSP
jgi:SAM-dependent methyltransferase